MRWPAVVLVALAGVPIVVVGVGFLLPKEHTATSHATIKAPPDSVWVALTDVDEFPAWRDDVARVEVLPRRDGHKIWREFGKADAVTFEEVEAVPPRRLVARIADPSLPFGGSWTYVVAPEDGGSRVTITEEGVVHNPVFRFVSRFVLGHHATQEAYLRALARRFGHDATPVRG
ncbi:MAG: SRPBCC domain-containing protein [Gemmatimonadaceae bacterium]